MKYYDASGYFVSRAARFPHIQLWGGPRRRLLGAKDFSLKKVTLFRSDTGVRLAVGAHALTKKLELAPVTGALMHFKFSASWVDKVLREQTENRRTQVGHYKKYNTLLNTDLSFLDPDASSLYQCSEDLVRDGIMTYNHQYTEALQEVANLSALKSVASIKGDPNATADPLDFLSLIPILSAAMAEAK